MPVSSPPAHPGVATSSTLPNGAPVLQTLLNRAQLSPENPDVLVDLALQLQALGQTGPALQLLEQTVRLHPGHARSWFTLAEVLLAMCEVSTACTCLKRAVQLAPENAEAQLRLAEVFAKLGESSSAAATYECLLRSQPANLVALVNLASLCRGQGDLARAVQLLQFAVHHHPGSAAALYNLGNCHAEQGEFAEARNSYATALPIHPQPAKVFYNLSTILKFENQHRDDISRWMQLVQSRPRTVEDEVHLQFALGKAHDDLGDTEQAWEHYHQGNSLVHTGFDPVAHAERLKTVARCWTQDVFERLPHAGQLPAQPIFIVGMPRSGTTLVEHLLTQRTGITARGEQSALPKVLRDSLAENDTDELLPPTGASVEVLSSLAADYIQQVVPPVAGDAAFTDKLPANFLRLGWIALLFPGAVVLHVRRDPRDVCLSCYFQHFTQRLPYAYRLDQLTAYWLAYDRLMEHWRSVLPLNVIEIQYEELVENPDEVMEQVLRSCGLDRSRKETPSQSVAISTASHWQARQAVHTRSRRKWERYQKWLPELQSEFGSSSDSLR